MYNDSVRKAIMESPDQAWATIFAPGLRASRHRLQWSRFRGFYFQGYAREVYFRIFHVKVHAGMRPN